MKEILKIDLKGSPVLGATAKKYLVGELDDLVHFSPDIDGIKKAIEERKKYSVNRDVLVKVLVEQNNNSGKKTLENINSLKSENSFTVTTGHQLCLFTGPLYFVYKILHAIKLAEELKSKFPENNFVPVYWMASEDHDFEEVSEVNLFGKKLKWENSQGGAVGKIQLTPLSFGHLPSERGETASTLQAVLMELKSILGDSEKAKGIFSVIEKAYSEKNLAEATRSLVNYLFKDTGLVIIDADNIELKKMFIPTMEKELKEQFVYNAVSKTNKYLEEKGFKVQVTPREINLFYLKDNFRERIINENGKYQTVNGEYKWNESEILDELNKHPENFSPNVLMRALYQETILPNLAYVGGGGEISYWLQMKNMFKVANVFFPVLMVRNSFLLVDNNTNEKITKLGFEVMDFFKSEEDLSKEFIQRNATAEIELSQESEGLKQLYAELAEKVKLVDASLEGSVNAELQKSLKSLEIIESKIRKAEKQKHEQSLNQIKNIKGKLFPEGNFQERYDNFLAYWMKTDGKLIEELYGFMGGVESEFRVIT